MDPDALGAVGGGALGPEVGSSGVGLACVGAGEGVIGSTGDDVGTTGSPVGDGVGEGIADGFGALEGGADADGLMVAVPRVGDAGSDGMTVAAQAATSHATPRIADVERVRPESRNPLTTVRTFDWRASLRCVQRVTMTRPWNIDRLRWMIVPAEPQLEAFQAELRGWEMAGLTRPPAT